MTADAHRSWLDRAARTGLRRPPFTPQTGYVTACWLASAGCSDRAIESEGVADEAVGADIRVVKTSGDGVVFACVPVQPSPALSCCFLPQEVEESSSNANASPGGIDVKILQETHGLCTPREGVQDADREAGQALGVHGEPGEYSVGVGHDALPQDVRNGLWDAGCLGTKDP